MLYDLPHDVATIENGVLRAASGAPVTARFALVPCGVEVSGRVVGRDARVSALVYALPPGPIRLAVSPGRAARCETLGP
jgi:hypothetical protein